MAQPLLNATELDFDQIKANLKAYFTRQDSPIKDWNFDGSGLNMLLDVLAYNTHYNAMLAHLNLNESFIDTAQLRSSVISQAKLLGYIPRSISAATARATVSFIPVSFPGVGSTLSIPVGTKFTGTSPNGSFTFITRASDVANYITSQSSYQITLPLIQGAYRSQTYQVDNSVAVQRFVIDDPSADISTLTVNVYENQSTSTPTPYIPISSFISGGGDISNVLPTSNIYNLSLASNGTYEVTFGDGIVGRALNNLNVVQLTYVSTQGQLANGISNFTYADSTLLSSDSIQVSSATVTVSSPSAGGADQESTDSIRLNAPASLISQNRAVTANDYVALIKNHFTAIKSINVWGGEEEVTYDPLNAARHAGKVYISYTSDTAVDSTDVISYVKPFKVMSVTPYYYPPDYINIYLNTNFKFNPNLTSKVSTDLNSIVADVVSEYNDSALQSFTGVFRHSNLLKKIDAADPSILNSDIQVSFYKNYTLNSVTNLTPNQVASIGPISLPNGLITTFGNKLFGTADQLAPMVTSSGFTLSSVLLPSQQPIQVTGTWSANSPTITIMSSPGTSTLSANILSNPYIVAGATVTASTTSFTTTSVTIQSINNTGSYTIITLNANASTVATPTSGYTLTITPPGGTYYLKDTDDPQTSSTRRLFMSKSPPTTPVVDPKYTSTGSDIHIGTLYQSTGKVEMYRYFNGNTSSQPVANYSLQDSSYGGVGTGWYQDQFKGCIVYITAGTGTGQAATVTTNSSNTLYWTSPAILLDSTSQYILIRSCVDTDTTGTIRVYSRPASNDVAPSRHQLITIDQNLSSVSSAPDSFAQAGVLGAANYTTFSRDPQ